MKHKITVSGSVSTSIEEVETDIGGRIQQIRGAMTQAEFARELGLHTNTLARYERNERTPDTDFLRVLFRTRQVEPKWVVFGVGPMKQVEPHASESRNEPLNEEVLQSVIEVIEKILTEKGLRLLPKKKSQLISACYELWLLNPNSQDNPARIFKMVNLAA